MENPDYGYPKSSNTDSTASGPTGNAPDMAMKGAAPDNGSAPPVAPRAASNKDQVTPHQTMCSGDAVLQKVVANGMSMHDEGSYVQK